MFCVFRKAEAINDALYRWWETITVKLWARHLNNELNCESSLQEGAADSDNDGLSVCH